MSPDTPSPSDEGGDLSPTDVDPRIGPTRPHPHTLQERLRMTAERRAQRQVRDHADDPQLAALVDLLNNGPAVPPAAAPPEPPSPPPAPSAAPPAPPVRLFRSDPVPVEPLPPRPAPRPPEPVEERAPAAPPPSPALPVVQPPAFTPATRPDVPTDDEVPSAAPSTFRSRRRARKDLRQERRARRMLHRRYRIFPRTIIGISAMVLVAGLVAGATGAVLYAYYDWRLTQNEDRVGDLAESLETRLTDANTAIENSTAQAVEDVRAEGDALRELIEDQNAIAALLPEISPSVWFVSTLNDSGQASVGSAFVVGTDGERSLLLTSYTTVSAATVDPAPEITLRKGDETMVATLYSWDPGRDLALLTVDRPDMQPLAWATEEERAVAAGKRGFAVTGLGGSDATVSPGQILDLTATEISHNIAVDVQYQGGPILTSAGKVLGVASLEYRPLNFENEGTVPFAIPIGLACEQVLTCNGPSPA